MGQKSPSHRWRSLFVLAFGNTIDTTDGGLINALFPAIRQALHLNLETLGLFTAISRISRMIFGPLWALAGDRWNRKTLMFLVTGVWGVWTVLAGLAQNQEQLLILYSIGTIGTVAAEPLTASITADLFSSEERGKAFGALRGIGGVGFVLFAPVLGLFSQSPEGWRWAMFGMGGLSILSGILVLIFLKDPGRGASEAIHVSDDRIRKGDLRLLLTRPTIWLMAVSMLMVTSLVLFSFSVTFLVDVRGFTNAGGTFVLAFFAVGYIVSSFLGGLLGDWAHRRAGFKGRIVLMQVYLVIYAAMAFLCLQIAWPVWLYYPLFFIFGLISALGFPGAVMPLVSAVVLPEVRSTAFGFLFSFVQGGVAAALSLGVGWLAQRHGLLPVVFWLTTVPYLLNAAFWFLFYRTVPRDIDRTKAELKTRDELVVSSSHDYLLPHD
jgi:predicted MFS family arabinose efflux permease